jgi:hypothetical protein
MFYIVTLGVVGGAFYGADRALGGLSDGMSSFLGGLIFVTIMPAFIVSWFMPQFTREAIFAIVSGGVMGVAWMICRGASANSLAEGVLIAIAIAGATALSYLGFYAMYTSSFAWLSDEQTEVTARELNVPQRFIPDDSIDRPGPWVHHYASMAVKEEAEKGLWFGAMGAIPLGVLAVMRSRQDPYWG